MSEHDKTITAAGASYDRMAWADACERYLAADHDEPLGPDDLERAAQAAQLSGRDDDADILWQRTVQGYEEAGNPERAALDAWRLGMSLMQRGDMAQAGGWFARAARSVEGLDTRVHGYLALSMALGELFGGDATSARPKFEFARELGDRFGDNDLRTLARLGLGRSLMQLGEDTGGLALLDDAMVTVTSGEASPLVIGIVYCAVIEECQLIFDVRRAREWTAALSRWCDAQPELVPFRGACLIHRSEIMTFNGAWANAMDEAVRACTYLAETHNLAVADALYQRAELCRLRGQFEEAEAFYMKASDGGREPQPGLALLRIAQGQTATAAAALRRALAEEQPPLERARLLAPYIEVLLATDDVTEAGAASEELDAISGRVACPYLDALAARAAGAVALADGAAPRALNLLRSAWSTWCDLEVPYEAARTRVLIGLACRELGDDETAVMDLGAARHTFVDLGAVPEIARVDGLLHAMTADAAPSQSGTLTGREVEVLQLVAAGNTNRQIAEALVISEKTVARHISNIFVKISVSSRSAATGYAYQHGLT
jgi:DNA-binding CsgD family transcriptional regulator